MFESYFWMNYSTYNLTKKGQHGHTIQDSWSALSMQRSPVLKSAISMDLGVSLILRQTHVLLNGTLSIVGQTYMHPWIGVGFAIKLVESRIPPTFVGEWNVNIKNIIRQKNPSLFFINYHTVVILCHSKHFYHSLPHFSPWNPWISPFPDQRS